MFLFQLLLSVILLLGLFLKPNPYWFKIELSTFFENPTDGRAMSFSVQEGQVRAMDSISPDLLHLQQVSGFEEGVKRGERGQPSRGLTGKEISPLDHSLVLAAC